MSWLELVGAAAIYIICVYVSGYVGAVFVMLLNRKGGLESFVLIPVVTTFIWVVGAVCGAVWLGVKIGEMS